MVVDWHGNYASTPPLYLLVVVPADHAVVHCMLIRMLAAVVTAE